MITTLCNLFGLQANAAAPVSAYPRQVDLSGNIFSFSMPENFSKDMPAEDMVEKLDISDIKKFDNPEYGNIIRRWWDIKSPGFFGKELGTVMMDISVQKVPENKQKLIHGKSYDIMDRLDFLLMIDDSLHQRYDKMNMSHRESGGDANDYNVDFCYLLGEKLKSHYRDYQYNGQKWIGYTITAPSAQLIVGLVMPINVNSYLELVFAFSPNQNVIPNEFLDAAHKTTQQIESSLYVNFSETNNVKAVVEGIWLNETNNMVMDKHRDKILVPYFGQDVYEKIENGHIRALELQKELEKSLKDK